MKKFMPLQRFVVEITNEARADDSESVRKALNSWHNRFQNGTVPRTVTKKIGRRLFIDLEKWEQWILEEQ